MDGLNELNPTPNEEDYSYSSIVSKLSNIASSFGKTALDALDTAINPRIIKDDEYTKQIHAAVGGFQSGAVPLMLRGTLPDYTLPENASRMESILYQSGMMLGDVPAMILGGIGGGVVGGVMGSSIPGPGTAAGVALGGGYGSLALPAMIRSSYMQALQKGEIQDFPDYWSRLVAVAHDTMKAGNLGLLTAGTGKLTSGALETALPSLPTVRSIGQSVAELSTLVTAGAAMEGKVPSSNDFIDGAITLGGYHSAKILGDKLMHVYAKTGTPPEDVFKDLYRDVQIAQDFATGNKIPDAYGGGTLKTEYKPASTADYVIADGKDITSFYALQAFKPVWFKQETLGPKYEKYDSLEVRIGDTTRLYEKGKLVQETIDPNYTPEEFADWKDRPENKRLVERMSDITKQINNPSDEPIQLYSWKENASIIDRLYEETVNRIFPVEDMVKEMKGEKDLLTSQDPGKLARLMYGVVGKAQAFLTTGTYDYHTLDKTGESLKSILLDIPNNDLNSFRKYWVSEHALELDARGIETGIDPIKAREYIVSTPDSAKYAGIVNRLVTYLNSTAKLLRDSGILSSDAYDKMTNNYKSYAAFYRNFEETGKRGGPGMAGFPYNPIKEIKGSERAIIDPLESVIKDTYIRTKLAEQNRLNKSYIDLALSSDNPDEWAQKVNRIQPTNITQQEISKFLDEPVDEGFTVFRNIHGELRRDEIPVYENGQRTVYKVDPTVANVLDTIDNHTYGLIIGAAHKMASMLRAGAVLTPDFLVKNPLRDVINAFLNTSKGIFSPIDTFKGAKAIFQKNADYDWYLKSGGPGAEMVALDRNYLQSSLAELHKQTDLYDRAWNVVKHPLDTLQMASTFLEQTNRVGAFIRELPSDRLTTKLEDIMRGGYASREATVDFARMGSKMYAWNLTNAFFNAQIQGTDRTMRAMKDNPIGFTLRALAGLTVPSLLLYATQYDDPVYQALPTYRKMLFWNYIINDWRDATPEDQFDNLPQHLTRINSNGQAQVNTPRVLALPKPFEPGIIFATFPELLIDRHLNHNPDALNGFTDAVISGAFPGLVPTIAVPVVEQLSNLNLLTFNKLVPDYLEKQLPAYRYKPYTTELSKAIGQGMEALPFIGDAANDLGHTGLGNGVARAFTSPIQIENYLRKWTGGVGDYILKLTDLALRKSGIIPDPEKATSKLSDNLFTRSFFTRYPSMEAPSINEFHAEMINIHAVWNTLRAQMLAQDPAWVDNFMSRHSTEFVKLDGVESSLRDLTKFINYVNLNKDWTPDEKQQHIDIALYNMIEISRFGLATVREFKDTMLYEAKR